MRRLLSERRNDLQRLIGILLLALLGIVHTAQALDSREIFEAREQAVYQIRVIHKETGKKSGIGSGFLVDNGQRLSTNYHVVAEYIREPDIYSLRYLANDGREGPLTLLDVDKEPPQQLLDTLASIEGVLSVRSLGGPSN